MPAMKIRRQPLLLLPLLLTCCDEGKQGDAPALSAQEMYEKGVALLKPNVENATSDVQGALEWTRKAAESGWAKAQTDMGWFHMHGMHGMKKDGAEALKWFSRAAEQGRREAEVFIGDIHSQGLGGMKKNYEEAMRHWRIAAEAGISEAQQRLGHALVYGENPQTFAEGLGWLHRAATEGAADGKRDAACDLGNIYARGKGGVQADMEKAAHWYAIAAEGGSVKAEFIYALLLLDGDVIPQDREAGMFMLRRAASRDYLPAMAEFIRQLRNAPEATAQQLQEADAWNKRLMELQEKQREQMQAAPQPASPAAPSGGAGQR